MYISIRTHYLSKIVSGFGGKGAAMFVGRDHELRILEDAYRSPRSELVVIYGRRRIGKSSLVRQFAEGKAAAEGWLRVGSTITSCNTMVGVYRNA